MAIFIKLLIFALKKGYRYKTLIDQEPGDSDYRTRGKIIFEMQVHIHNVILVKLLHNFKQFFMNINNYILSMIDISV